MCLACSKGRSTQVKSVCINLHSKLVEMNMKAVTLYKTTKESNYLYANLQLSEWIRNLKKECPPEDDLNLIKLFLYGEHTDDTE